MAITVNDATAATNASGASPVTWTHVVSAGSNRILVVGVVAENSDTPQTVSGVAYGAASLTKARARSVTEGAWVDVELWYLLNPTVGSASVSVSLTGSGVNAIACLSCTLQGAAQQAPEAVNDNGTTTDATTLSQAITTLTDNAMVLSLFGTNLENTQTSGQTSVVSALGSAGGDGDRVTLARATKTPAGSQTMSWTSSSTYGRAAMVNAVFAPAVTTISGSASITEAGDATSASGALKISGSVARTEATDTSSSTGKLALHGVVAASEGADSSTATGALRVPGAVARTEAADTCAATGKLALKGAVAAAETADSCAAAGKVAMKGGLEITEANDVATSAGELPIVGHGGGIETNDNCATSGKLALKATASITEAGDTLTSNGSGVLQTTGALHVTEVNDTASATGRVQMRCR